jgi:hypothetical protein
LSLRELRYQEGFAEREREVRKDTLMVHKVTTRMMLHYKKERNEKVFISFGLIFLFL